MNKKSQRDITIFMFLLFIVLRIVGEFKFDKYGNDLIIASITAISLFVTIIVLIEDTFITLKKIEDKVNKRYFSKLIDRIKNMKIIIKIILIIIMILYVILCRNSFINDIITIFTLMISILSNDIVEFVVKKICK